MVGQIRVGNVAAFDQLYRQLYPALSLLALRFTQNRESAQDIVADVFLHLWEGRSGLPAISNLKAYLYLSTRNRAINYLKSKAVATSTELNDRAIAAIEPTAEAFFQSLLHIETVRALREAVDALPVECKKVTELVLKGHSTNEIAGMLGITASAVSHQKTRAVRILKDNLLLLMLAAIPACLAVG